ncbi:MAG TPA: hypothetical protein VHE13_14835 [Opitutus sp.]|nr:hypothetical protein [Opitutus sp.]
MPPVLRERKPWPMKWVVLAIVLAIVPYTILTLRYRKPGKMFEPYHDMKERANTMRLLSVGFQRITLEASRLVDPTPGMPAAPVFPARGGLPPELDLNLIDRPLLPAEIQSVHAASSINAVMSYPVELRCSQPDGHQQLGSADLYVHGHELVIVPSFERLSGELLARTSDNLIRLTVPAGALKAGLYHVTLVGSRLSQAWTLDVK